MSKTGTFAATKNRAEIEAAKSVISYATMVPNIVVPDRGNLPTYDSLQRLPGIFTPCSTYHRLRQCSRHRARKTYILYIAEPVPFVTMKETRGERGQAAQTQSTSCSSSTSG